MTSPRCEMAWNTTREAVSLVVLFTFAYSALNRLHSLCLAMFSSPCERTSDAFEEEFTSTAPMMEAHKGEVLFSSGMKDRDECCTPISFSK